MCARFAAFEAAVTIDDKRIAYWWCEFIDSWETVGLQLFWDNPTAWWNQ
jgi:hypothetical protein